MQNIIKILFLLSEKTKFKLYYFLIILVSASIIDDMDQEDVPEKDTEEVELEGLPPLEEEDLLNLDIEEPIDNVSDFKDEEKIKQELTENGVEEEDLEELPPLEEEDLLNLDFEEPIDNVSDFYKKEKNEKELPENDAEEEHSSIVGRYERLNDVNGKPRYELIGKSQGMYLRTY